MEGNWDYQHAKLYEGDSFSIGGRSYQVADVAEKNALVLADITDPTMSVVVRVSIIGGKQRP